MIPKYDANIVLEYTLILLRDEFYRHQRQDISLREQIEKFYTREGYFNVQKGI